MEYANNHIQDNTSETVSVIVPMYNVEKYLERSIESVLNQTYKNIEVICVDDGSNDCTWEIINRYALADDRIKVISLGKNAGAANARNIAIENATGAYLAFFDADDLWLPNKIEMQIEFMKKQNFSFSCTACAIADEGGVWTGRIIHPLMKYSLKDYLKNNTIQTPSVMVNLNSISKKLLYVPKELLMRNDIYIWMSILKTDIECGGMDTVLTVIRKHKDSLSGNKIKSAKGMWKMYFKYAAVPAPFALYCFIRYVFCAIWKRTKDKNGINKEN